MNCVLPFVSLCLFVFYYPSLKYYSCVCLLLCSVGVCFFICHSASCCLFVSLSVNQSSLMFTFPVIREAIVCLSVCLVCWSAGLPVRLWFRQHFQQESILKSSTDSGFVIPSTKPINPLHSAMVRVSMRLLPLKRVPVLVPMPHKDVFRAVFDAAQKVSPYGLLKNLNFHMNAKRNTWSFRSLWYRRGSLLTHHGGLRKWPS